MMAFQTLLLICDHLKIFINKLSLDVCLDIDSHVSLSLVSGGLHVLNTGYLANHFLELNNLTIVSDFKPGVSFFLKSFDNFFNKIAFRGYSVKKSKIFSASNTPKFLFFFIKNIFLQRIFNLNFYIMFIKFFFL